MNDSMKRPPMQQDAERLAAQGRFGDSMLVHMNPEEVRGIASLAPGGRLTINPETGQPEAFLSAIVSGIKALAPKVLPFLKKATTAKAAYDAFKGPKGTGQTAANRQRQQQLDQYTQGVLRDVGQSKAFAIPQTLRDMVAAGDISKATSFLPQGVAGLNLTYQGMPNQMYANYQTPEKFGERLTGFGMTPGEAMPIPTTGGIADVLVSEPTVDEDEGKPDDGFTVDEESILAGINNQREKAGLPPFDTYQDFLNSINESLPFDIRMPMMGPGTIEMPRSGGIGGLDSMTMNQLNIPDINFDEASIGVGFADGGIARLSNGGEMDFPRMNGPISGPGTETSDDIPAMLSDGEFVVNAKAVRGIGKIGGANKSKADQRREGAKMMYALQRAGEKAMRSA